jgi:hypothetical protein
MSNKFTNPIVEEKNRAQDKMAKKAGYDIHKYAVIMKQETRKLVKKYGLRIKYAELPGIAELPAEYGQGKKEVK